MLPKICSVKERTFGLRKQSRVIRGEITWFSIKILPLIFHCFVNRKLLHCYKTFYIPINCIKALVSTYIF